MADAAASSAALAAYDPSAPEAKLMKRKFDRQKVFDPRTVYVQTMDVGAACGRPCFSPPVTHTRCSIWHQHRNNYGVVTFVISGLCSQTQRTLDSYVAVTSAHAYALSASTNTRQRHTCTRMPTDGVALCLSRRRGRCVVYPCCSCVRQSRPLTSPVNDSTCKPMTWDRTYA